MIMRLVCFGSVSNLASCSLLCPEAAAITVGSEPAAVVAEASASSLGLLGISSSSVIPGRQICETCYRLSPTLYGHPWSKIEHINFCPLGRVGRAADCVKSPNAHGHSGNIRFDVRCLQLKCHYSDTAWKSSQTPLVSPRSGWSELSAAIHEILAQKWNNVTK